MSAILCISLVDGTDKNEAVQLVDRIAEYRSGRDRPQLVFITKPYWEASGGIQMGAVRSTTWETAEQHRDGLPKS